MAKEYRDLLQASTHQEVQEMMMTWKDEVEAKGREEGLEEGREEGRVEGREEGLEEGMRSLLVRQLTQRFGPLPSRIRRQLATTKSIQKLEQVADQVLSIQTLQELVWD